MAIFPVGDKHYNRIYVQEAALIDAAEAIAEAMESREVTSADLARLLGVNRSEVTARLRGTRNITLKSLAETLHALDHRLVIEAEPVMEADRHSPQDAWLPAHRSPDFAPRSERVVLGWKVPSAAH